MSEKPFVGFSFPVAGGITARTMPDRLAEVKNVKEFGAIGDNAIHLLSEIFTGSGALAAAQAVYPFVTSLSQSIDWAAIQAAINAAASYGVLYSPGCEVLFPAGIYQVTDPIVDPTTTNPNGISFIRLRGSGRTCTKISGTLAGYIINKSDTATSLQQIECISVTNYWGAVCGNASISADVLTIGDNINADTSPAFRVGMLLFGDGVPNAWAGNCSISGSLLTVSAAGGYGLSGAFLAGMQLMGDGVTLGTTILSQASGSGGGYGTYNLDRTSPNAGVFLDHGRAFWGAPAITAVLTGSGGIGTYRLSMSCPTVASPALISGGLGAGAVRFENAEQGSIKDCAFSGFNSLQATYDAYCTTIYNTDLSVIVGGVTFNGEERPCPGTVCAYLGQANLYGCSVCYADTGLMAYNAGLVLEGNRFEKNYVAINIGVKGPNVAGGDLGIVIVGNSTEHNYIWLKLTNASAFFIGGNAVTGGRAGTNYGIQVLNVSSGMIAGTNISVGGGVGVDLSNANVENLVISGVNCIGCQNGANNWLLPTGYKPGIILQGCDNPPLILVSRDLPGINNGYGSGGGYSAAVIGMEFNVSDSVDPIWSGISSNVGKPYVGGGTYNVKVRCSSAATCDGGSISGSVLTVGGNITGKFEVGQSIMTPGIWNNFPTISSLGTGTGGAGTYNLSASPAGGSGLVVCGSIWRLA